MGVFPKIYYTNILRLSFIWILYPNLIIRKDNTVSFKSSDKINHRKQLKIDEIDFNFNEWRLKGFESQ